MTTRRNIPLTACALEGLLGLPGDSSCRFQMPEARFGARQIQQGAAVHTPRIEPGPHFLRTDVLKQLNGFVRLAVVNKCQGQPAFDVPGSRGGHAVDMVGVARRSPGHGFRVRSAPHHDERADAEGLAQPSLEIVVAEGADCTSHIGIDGLRGLLEPAAVVERQREFALNLNRVRIVGPDQAIEVREGPAQRTMRLVPGNAAGPA